ncbi:MAG: VRR-NUC domain-containing protein [Lachnospiraceae bacterium]|nr:VRR-NUC domain-containing protein [Lachnospiraceae bacterium]
MSESNEQQVVFEWASWNANKYPGLETMYHIPNEGKRSASNGRRLKREGLKCGVSDICIPVAKSGYSNLYIELKAGKNKATTSQREFIESINKYGGKALVVYEADNAIEVIKAYFNGTINQLEIIDDEYPHKKRKSRQHRGFCGEICEKCKNTKCLERKIRNV